jgi:hypothetical protein
MQLWQEGVLQGLGVDAIPGTERPKNLDGTMVGDIGFDPLGFSNWLNLNWAREAEIKHGRIAMLAATGMIVQVGTKLTYLHFTGCQKLQCTHRRMIGSGCLHYPGIRQGLQRCFHDEAAQPRRRAGRHAATPPLAFPS